MPVAYNTVARPNPKNPHAPKKYYPSVKATGRTDLRKLSDLISEISSLSNGDVLNAITSLLKVIPEELKNGNIVELGEFGSFSRKDTGTVWLRNTASGVNEEEQVSAAQVTNLLVRFIPGQEFKRALIGTHLVQARRRTIRSRGVRMR